MEEFDGIKNNDIVETTWFMVHDGKITKVEKRMRITFIPTRNTYTLINKSIRNQMKILFPINSYICICKFTTNNPIPELLKRLKRGRMIGSLRDEFPVFVRDNHPNEPHISMLVIKPIKI